MYIALEWVVWVGKSTQTELLAKRLQEFSWKEVVTVREPWGTEIAQAIRTLVQATKFEEMMKPITDAYLYASARAQLIHWRINPALEIWKIVLSDRCVASSLAIQWVAQWYGIQNVWEINSSAVSTCLPNMIIFLDLPVEEWLARTFDADGDKWESRPTQFSHKIYEWYEQLFSFAPLQNCMVRVDASWTVEEVFIRLKKIIESFMAGDAL